MDTGVQDGRGAREEVGTGSKSPFWFAEAGRGTWNGLGRDFSATAGETLPTGAGPVPLRGLAQARPIDLRRPSGARRLYRFAELLDYILGFEFCFVFVFLRGGNL